MHSEEYLYQHLEITLQQEIQSGQRRAGERMPSIRELSQAKQLSKSTVIHAYSRLEAAGLIEARPRSGYFVSQHNKTGLQSPAPSKPVLNPKAVSASQILQEIMQQGTAFDVIHQSGDEGNTLLKRSLAWGQRQQGEEQQLYYDEPQGLLSLRETITQRMGLAGGQYHVDEIVITGGCQHAMLLALMAVTQPGDIVAMESPGFYGAFQLIQALNLKVVELPSSAQTGVSPEALEIALKHWDIKAVIVSPNFSTPTGALMPIENKQRLLDITRDKQIAVIEDDIYGELQFDLQRPRSLYSLNPDDNVLLCSSFSKSLSRDLRLGWIAPGNYKDKVQQLKLVTSLASSRSVQAGLAHYLAQGNYERYLRKRRQQLKAQCMELQTLVAEHLPMAVGCSQPKGGLCLWMELPKGVDTLELYHQAKQQGISLAPGLLFTAQARYKQFLRLSFQHAWTGERREAMATLGQLVREQE